MEIKDLPNEEPPSNTEGIMDISTAHIPANDIKSKPKVGWWDRFNRPILYPAGGSVCTRCHSILMDISKE